MTIGLKIKPSSTALLFKCFKIQSEHSVYIFALLKLVHQIGINVDIFDHPLRKTCFMPLLEPLHSPFVRWYGSIWQTSINFTTPLWYLQALNEAAFQSDIMSGYFAFSASNDDDDDDDAWAASDDGMFIISSKNNLEESNFRVLVRSLMLSSFALGFGFIYLAKKIAWLRLRLLPVIKVASGSELSYEAQLVCAV